MSSVNRFAYETPYIVEQYARSDDLYPAEHRIFHLHTQQFHGSVLDIAVGAGRTTRALCSSCERYVGIDCSSRMIASAHRCSPQADLRVMDMRDVPAQFRGSQFDAILISLNSIDCISWEDRCRLLPSLAKLVAPEGVLVFSTHDLADADRQRRFRLRSDLQRSLRQAYRPRSLARFLLRAPPWLLKAWRNRLRTQPLQKSFEDYAYVNDSAEDYGLLLVYVLIARQVDLLKACGFSRVEVMQPWLNSEPTSFRYLVCQH